MDWTRNDLRLMTAMLVGALATGCPSDDEPAEETDSGTDASSTSSTTMAPTTDTTSSSTTDGTTSTSTTTSTTTTDSGTSGSTGTTGAAVGTCFGFDLIGSVAAVLSRDGGNVGGSCDETPAACGGDIVGAWTFENACGEDNNANLWGALCPGATQQINSTNTVGTLSFVDDDTFTQMSTTTTDMQIEIDVSTCLGITCDALDTLLNGEDGVTSTCTGEDTACQCDLELIEITNVAGTYAVMDNDVLLTVDAEDTAIPFCVMNDRLDLWTPQYQPTFTGVECTETADCEAELGDQNELYVCDFEEEMALVSEPWTNALRRR